MQVLEKGALSITAGLAPVLAILLCISGCTSINQREYGPFVRELDEYNVLEISTYPADFPKRLTDKEDSFQEYESHDEVFFQVFIRASDSRSGPNPYVESITIHHFSFQFDDESPTVLLKEYPNNFWMQGSPRYDKQNLPPIPYRSDGKVFIEIDFTLNGKHFRFEGDMEARESTSTMPTIIVKQGV